MSQRESSVSGDPLTLSRSEVGEHLRLSRTGLFLAIRRGDAPEPDFYVGNKPRWVRVRFETWLRQRTAALACQERIDAADPVGARAELSKLEEATEALERDAS